MNCYLHCKTEICFPRPELFGTLSKLPLSAHEQKTELYLAYPRIPNPCESWFPVRKQATKVANHGCRLNVKKQPKQGLVFENLYEFEIHINHTRKEFESNCGAGKYRR